MCIFLLQWTACMWKWIQERTGDENFADSVVCHVSFVHLMPMQLLVIILCYFFVWDFYERQEWWWWVRWWAATTNNKPQSACGRVPRWRHLTPAAQRSRLFFSLLALQDESFLKPRSPREESQMLWITCYEWPPVFWMEERQKPFSNAITRRLPRWAGGLRKRVREHKKRTEAEARRRSEVELGTEE